LKAWQTFRLSAGFRCVFRFTQIHLHAFLQMRLQQYAQVYPARSTQGSAGSKKARSSALRAKPKFWLASEATALSSGATLPNMEAPASIGSSGQQTTQPSSMRIQLIV
jgi:hypothetical protein